MLTLFSLSTPFLSPFSLSLADPPLPWAQALERPARASLRRCPAAHCPAISTLPARPPLTSPSPVPSSLPRSAQATSTPQTTGARRRAATPPWHPTSPAMPLPEPLTAAGHQCRARTRHRSPQRPPRAAATVLLAHATRPSAPAVAARPRARSSAPLLPALAPAALPLPFHRRTHPCPLPFPPTLPQAVPRAERSPAPCPETGRGRPCRRKHLTVEPLLPALLHPRTRSS